jgi:hypothetical protein
MEGIGRALDGSAFAEKTLSVYRAEIDSETTMELSVVENRERQRSIIISINNYPMMNLRGSMPNEDNVFFLTSLEYLAGNTHGWNEYSLQMLGYGSLTFGDNVILEYINEIEPIQITQGRIHRYDTRLTGNDALTSLRNRHDRILALTEWMVTLDSPKGQSINDFSNYWKPVFFPEMVSKQNKPFQWHNENDVFVRAEDIRWNTCYTQRIFPEELWPVRNSGTLLRDWEEALSLIYLEYEWDNIVNLFSNQIIFNKVR